MKKYIIVFSLLLICVLSNGQSTDKNFIITRAYKQTGNHPNDVSKVNIQVQYVDGIGRPSQQVSVGQSTTGTDIISPTEYDAYGREPKNFLPYAAGSNGVFQSGATSAQGSFYSIANAPGLGLDASDVARPYLETSFEAAPLNRPLTQRAAGNKSGNESISYGSNGGDVILYNYASGSVSSSGSYPAGTLYRTQTTDENARVSTEFKDIHGLLVCKKITNGGETLSTYYVYDEQKRLRAVLQPQYQDDANFGNFAFLYDYDSRGRMISKSIPGAGVVEMVYDNYDRMAMCRDAGQAARGVWGFTKYDIFSRPVMTGELPSTRLRSDWQSDFNGSTAHHENRITTTIGYSFLGTLPTVSQESYVKTVIYYDDYSFPGSLAYSDRYSIGTLSSVKTRPTGTRTKMLDAAGNWLISTTYYDSEYRPVQTVRQLYDLGPGATERVSTKYKYDLASVVAEELTEQKLPSVTNSHLKTFEYDHADRLLSVREKVTQGAIAKEATTVAHRYNILGQLKQKWLHADDAVYFRRRTDYLNNIRGWLTQGQTSYVKTQGAAESPFYKFGLAYDNGTNYTNGNISQMQWAGKDESAYTKGLAFTYDGANRLLGSSALNGNVDIESGISYDKNGNIKTLTRSGAVSDILTYSYAGTGNKLASVSDAGTASGVKNGTSAYSYDANGNMLTDGNRGATLTYNYLNLPATVVIGSGSAAKMNTYDYDASGTKHRYKYKFNTAAADTIHRYAGGFEYQEVTTGNSLYRVALSEGQAVFRYNQLKFDYYLKDHLGNVRVVINDSGKILQKTDYYPFGLAIDRTSPVISEAARNGTNRYLYNGKESQPGSKYLDYGARMYMPEIGRFGALDNKAELLEMSSPFAYSLNSPLIYIDKEGELPIFINGKVSSDSQRGSKSYWDSQLLASIKNSGIANPGGDMFFVDGDRYATYSMGRNYVDRGGWIEDGANSPDRRHVAGYETAKRDFESIMAKLARDPQSGKITEKIQIYTHSRGAAFGTGYTEALLELIANNGDQFADANNVIDFVYNMAPHQSNSLRSPAGVDGYSSDHSFDVLSGNDMKGLKAAFKSNEGGSFLGQHATKSFVRDAAAFTKSFLSNQSNSTKLISDFVQKMKSQYGINVTVLE